MAHYNGSKFIKDQLDSILENQLTQSVHVLLIDDCSSVEEFRRLTILASKYPQITLIRNERNLGVIKTFEKGLSLSTAPFVMFCDQDDVWMRRKVELSFYKIQSLDQSKPCLVFCDLEIVDENLYVIYPSMRKLFGFNEKNQHSILLQNIVTGCTMMFNRKLIELSLPFPEGIVIHDHWLALCAAYSGSISFIDEPLVKYRQHSNNLIGASKNNLFAIAWKYKKFIPAYKNDLKHTIIQIRLLSDRLQDRGFNYLEILDVYEKLTSLSFREILFLKKINVLRYDLKFLVILAKSFKTSLHNFSTFFLVLCLFLRLAMSEINVFVLCS